MSGFFMPEFIRAIHES